MGLLRNLSKRWRARLVGQTWLYMCVVSKHQAVGYCRVLSRMSATTSSTVFSPAHSILCLPSLLMFPQASLPATTQITRFAHHSPPDTVIMSLPPSSSVASCESSRVAGMKCSPDAWRASSLLISISRESFKSTCSQTWSIVDAALKDSVKGWCCQDQTNI